MGQDLKKMVSVFVGGLEEVREVSGFLFHNQLNGMIPVPVLNDNETIIFSDKGQVIIVDSCLIENGGNC